MSTHTGGIMLLAVAMSMPAVAQEDTGRDPDSLADSSRIRISGTVVSPTAEGFSLDYGDGTIRVTVPESPAYAEAYEQMAGDHATVFGQVDADLFERDTIEAQGVYSENLATYFPVRTDDTEGTDTVASYFWEAPGKLEINEATIRGTVTGTDPDAGEFMLDTGAQELTIETAALDYDPLDEHGFQKVESGDVVSVTGDFDSDVLEGFVLDAHTIVSLADDDRDSSVVPMPSVSQ